MTYVHLNKNTYHTDMSHGHSQQLCCDLQLVHCQGACAPSRSRSKSTLHGCLGRYSLCCCTIQRQMCISINTLIRRRRHRVTLNSCAVTCRLRRKAIDMHHRRWRYVNSTTWQVASTSALSLSSSGIGQATSVHRPSGKWVHGP